MIVAQNKRAQKDHFDHFFWKNSIDKDVNNTNPRIIIPILVPSPPIRLTPYTMSPRRVRVSKGGRSLAAVFGITKTDLCFVPLCGIPTINNKLVGLLNIYPHHYRELMITRQGVRCGNFLRE